MQADSTNDEVHDELPEASEHRLRPRQEDADDAETVQPETTVLDQRTQTRIEEGAMFEDVEGDDLDELGDLTKANAVSRPPPLPPAPQPPTAQLSSISPRLRYHFLLCTGDPQEERRTRVQEWRP